MSVDSALYEPSLIVVPCFNEEKTLEGVVADLLRQVGFEKLVIAIVDGASTDRTAEIARNLAARHSNVVLIDNPHRLQSAAVNMAVQALGKDFDYLIRVDAHSSYPPDFCRVLVSEAMRTGADSVVVSMKTEGKKFFQRAAAAAQNSPLGNGGSAHRSLQSGGKWVDHGHHALIRVKAFEAVGGYDPTFSHNEDAELDMRLAKAGFKCWLTNATAINYYSRETPWKLFMQYFRYGRGRARTIAKHGSIKIRQIVPLLILPMVLLALAAPVSWLAAVPAAAWAGLCLIWGVVIGINERSLPGMMSGVAAIIIQLGWSAGFWWQALRHPFARQDR
ncbi:glycosyltransferase family 2 protein [Chthonobacter rhizosphaerae]|uniref:glycosyltransferase family 2 protein n=1 Tax=Chthonobacter rhizosphaerae TaxID=2735553 RepID=UPI0015EEF1AE|nr:glycosyltransferase family 2 protein [Chthonobacter rhizosphaerae]